MKITNATWKSKHSLWIHPVCLFPYAFMLLLWTSICLIQMKKKQTFDYGHSIGRESKLPRSRSRTFSAQTDKRTTCCRGGRGSWSRLVSSICFFLWDKVTTDEIWVQSSLHSMHLSLSFVHVCCLLYASSLCAVSVPPAFCFQNSVFSSFLFFMDSSLIVCILGCAGFWKTTLVTKVYQQHFKYGDYYVTVDWYLLVSTKCVFWGYGFVTHAIFSSFNNFCVNYMSCYIGDNISILQNSIGGLLLRLMATYHHPLRIKKESTWNNI